VLADLRILELSAPETMLAGLVLADLGAEVLVVEPPAGAPGRRLEPFLADRPGLERSLTWHALNRNKRALTLDLATPDGLDLLASLLPRFDAVLEAPGPEGSPLEGLGLPSSLVRCAVHPFAAEGPKSDYLSSDLVVMASTGAPGMTGPPDRPPVFFPIPQSIMEAGAEAAIAALAALAARDRDGEGQIAEVSTRLAGMLAAFTVPLQVAAGAPDLVRGLGAFAGVAIPSVYACANGHVVIPIAFGQAFGPMTQRLARWAAEEGHLSSELAELDWPSFPARLQAEERSPADLQALVAGVSALMRTKPKQEIDAMSRKLGLLSSSMWSMEDIYASAQYRERGLWVKAPIPAAGVEIDAPARFAQVSNFSIETRRPAPGLSEHTVEVLESELGLSRLETQALFVNGII
jgi:benzylsuccinate CoA-transferase BbsE subunit